MAEKITPPSEGVSTYFRWSAVAALGTIVTPAANTSGVRVSFAQAACNAGTHHRIMTKASAPTGFGDAGAGTVVFALTGTSGIRAGEFVIPPGIGLYEQPFDAAANTLAAINYEVL